MKRFDPDKDVFLADSFITEGQTLVRGIFSGSDGTASNITNGQSSGSCFLICYDKTANNEAAHKIATVSYGYTTSSAMYTGSFIPTNQKEKLKIYRLFAQKLLGNPNLKFKINGTERHELIFLTIYRNLYKDGVAVDANLKLSLNTTGTFDAAPTILTYIQSSKTEKTFGGNSVFLIEDSISSSTVLAREQAILFAQQGIFVIDPLAAIGTSSTGGNFWSGSLGYEELAKGISGSTLPNLLFGVRHRISQVMFNNTVNIHSYFLSCVAEKSEFNYSSNPSFRNSNGEIFTTSGTFENLKSTTYITRIGLFNENDELLAVAKVKRAVKKNSDTKLSIYVRLDY